MGRTRRGTHTAPALRVKNVREPVSPDDGERILVDRLWPRALAKQRAHLDGWLRDLAPSTELRRWFGHDPARWDQFRARYRQELQEQGHLDALRELRARARHAPVTLVFDARDREHNDAVALAEMAEEL